jgi:hypothetical protein
MLLIVEYDLLGDTDVGFCSFAHRLHSVKIPVEAREITAGDVKSDTMPGLEDVTRL